MRAQRADKFDVDISMVSALGNDLLVELSKLRELEPIHWSEASRGWIITRHADVDDALQGKFPLSLRRVERIIFGPLPDEEKAQLPLLQRFIPHWPIEMDPPEHTRLRKLLVKAFSKKVVEAQKPFVQQRVKTLIDKLAQNPEVEFNEEIARQLPGSVILKLYGMPQEYLPKLKDWANSFQEGIGVPYATLELKKKAEQSMVEMTELFMAEIEKRRKNPQQDDLISSLLSASEGGDSLSEDEMLGALQLVLVAGHDTTSSTLTMGLAALADHPHLWDYMYKNPDKMLESSLELMRYISMSTTQVRVALNDFEWHGKQIKKGDFVWLMFAAANRDPRVFENPESIDPTRNNERSMVFAPGLHHCIGHLLAKLQVTEFFGQLVQRFEGAKVLDPRLNFMSQIAFRGLYHLNVRMQLRK
ncbi:MAG: cytochrome P450 [Steroidobacteraceae bacterium]